MTGVTMTSWEDQLSILSLVSILQSPGVGVRVQSATSHQENQTLA